MTNLGGSHAEEAQGFTFGKVVKYAEPLIGLVGKLFQSFAH